MARAFQPLLRRASLFRTQSSIHHLRFQPRTLIPIWGSSQLLSTQPQSTAQSKSTSYAGETNELRKSALEENLLRRIRSEIRYELERSPPFQPPAELNGFKVDERPGQQWVSLGKKFGENEEIKVEVTMFDGSAPVGKSGKQKTQLGEELQLHITLIVSIFKQESNQVLEFICDAWPDSLGIQKVFLRQRAVMPHQPYTGPPFRELDDQLQDSLYEYLEERGIDDTLCSSLHKYMNYKDNAEYIQWMKSLKSAVQEGSS